MRLFNVYGTRSRTSGTYGAMFGVLAQNLKTTNSSRRWNSKKRFTYISDIIGAFVKCMNVKNFQIFNVGTGKPISVNKVVKLLGCKSIKFQKGQVSQTKQMLI